MEDMNRTCIMLKCFFIVTVIFLSLSENVEAVSLSTAITTSSVSKENDRFTTTISTQTQLPHVNVTEHFPEDLLQKHGVKINIETAYDEEYKKIMLNVSWINPIDKHELKQYDFKVTPIVSNSSYHKCDSKSLHMIGKDKNLTNILLPPKWHKNEIYPGCTYNVSVIKEFSDYDKIWTSKSFTLKECEYGICSCENLTLPPEKIEVVIEVFPRKLKVSWIIKEDLVNKITNIQSLELKYREASKNRTVFNLLAKIPNIENRNYVLIDIDKKLTFNVKYSMQATFLNIYNCKTVNLTNFTVPDISIKTNVTAISLSTEITTSGPPKVRDIPIKTNVTVYLVLGTALVFISFLMLTTIPKTRLLMKKTLWKFLSFFNTNNHTQEAGTTYVIVPTIAARQCTLNQLYTDAEILDGSVDSYEFPRSRLVFIREIGSGAFGQVHLAKALGVENELGYTLVAVKMLKEGAPTEETEDFLLEMEIHKKIGKHPNIVKMFGCCTLKQPYLMMMEYIPCGDLRCYLMGLREKWKNRRTRKDSTPVFSDSSDCSYVWPNNQRSRIESEGPSLAETEYTMLSSEGFPTPTEIYNDKAAYTLDHIELQNFALQIARGMEHLEKIPIAHRDLAARNILIDQFKTLKITDFGLSRVGPYVNCKGKRMPLRWVAIEAILHRFYDSKGDVWSFGVVLWEIGTLGAFPYGNIPDEMILPYLLNGERLSRPEVCTDELYSLMLLCWSHDPQLRPSFRELVEMLDVTKKNVYVDFNHLNPLYVFPSTKTTEAENSENT